MKALAKLVTDFVAWRWAPTVAILTASLFYVLLVVGLVPREIDVPITNPQFKPKPAATATAAEPATTPAVETVPAAAPAAAAEQNQPVDFGRRGFSPPLARPDPPPTPPPPPPPPPPVIVPPAPVVPAPEAAPAPESAAAPAVEAAPTVQQRLRVPGLPRNMTTLMKNVTNALAPVPAGDPNTPPGAVPPGAVPPGAAPPGSAGPPNAEAPPPPVQ